MSNLSKPGDAGSGWGEDVFALVAVRAVGNPSMVAAAEEAVRTRYRIELRPRFESDPNVRESLPEDRPATECREWVLDALKGSCREGTETLFEQVVDELLKEIDHFRSLPPALYLVDERTGQVLLPLKEGLVQRPPDFVGDDGMVHRARLIVHPGLSSALAMKDQGSARTTAAMERADAAGPMASLAVLHERDPGSIARVAEEYLRSNGVTAGPVGESGTESSVEFGREFYDGVLQSPNYAFHRFRMFGELLGRKVLEAMGGPGTCELGQPELQSSSKHRWYRVSFRFLRTQ